MIVSQHALFVVQKHVIMKRKIVVVLYKSLFTTFNANTAKTVVNIVMTVGMYGQKVAQVKMEKVVEIVVNNSVKVVLNDVLFVMSVIVTIVADVNVTIVKSVLVASFAFGIVYCVKIVFVLIVVTNVQSA